MPFFMLMDPNYPQPGLHLPGGSGSHSECSWTGRPRGPVATRPAPGPTHSQDCSSQVALVATLVAAGLVGAPIGCRDAVPRWLRCHSGRMCLNLPSTQP